VTTAEIIPTLNEVEGMKKVVSKIKKEWVDEIIIVDGGSTDGTVEEAQNLGFEVIKQKTDGSHGAAIFDGFEYSKADMLLMFGADGNNEPEEIPKTVEMMKKGYEPARIGSERKMHRIPAGCGLVSRAVIEFIFWKD